MKIRRNQQLPILPMTQDFSCIIKDYISGYPTNLQRIKVRKVKIKVIKLNKNLYEFFCV